MELNKIYINIWLWDGELYTSETQAAETLENAEKDFLDAESPFCIYQFTAVIDLKNDTNEKINILHNICDNLFYDGCLDSVDAYSDLAQTVDIRLGLSKDYEYLDETARENSAPKINEHIRL